MFAPVFNYMPYRLANRFGTGRTFRLRSADQFSIYTHYLGAWFGITWAAWVYQHGGWQAVIGCCRLLVAVPFTAGVLARRAEQSAPYATANVGD